MINFKLLFQDIDSRRLFLYFPAIFAVNIFVFEYLGLATKSMLDARTDICRKVGRGPNVIVNEANVLLVFPVEIQGYNEL
jgi:hypothetical protein